MEYWKERVSKLCNSEVFFFFFNMSLKYNYHIYVPTVINLWSKHGRPCVVSYNTFGELIIRLLLITELSSSVLLRDDVRISLTRRILIPFSTLQTLFACFTLGAINLRYLIFIKNFYNFSHSAYKKIIH